VFCPQRGKHFLTAARCELGVPNTLLVYGACACVQVYGTCPWALQTLVRASLTSSYALPWLRVAMAARCHETLPYEGCHVNAWKLQSVARPHASSLRRSKVLRQGNMTHFATGQVCHEKVCDVPCHAKEHFALQVHKVWGQCASRCVSRA
jgi:hypothetical protein